MGFKKKVQETPKKINLLNEDEEAKEFILKKQKKIIPIGGKKARVKDRDLDVRRNKLVGIYILRFIILLVVVAIFGIAIKNAFFPENVFTILVKRGLNFFLFKFFSFVFSFNLCLCFISLFI